MKSGMTVRRNDTEGTVSDHVFRARYDGWGSPPPTTVTLPDGAAWGYAYGNPVSVLVFGNPVGERL